LFFKVKKRNRTWLFAQPRAKAELPAHISTLLFNFLFAFKKISEKKFAAHQQQRANLQSLSFNFL